MDNASHNDRMTEEIVGRAPWAGKHAEQRAQQPVGDKQLQAVRASDREAPLSDFDQFERGTSRCQG